jgi:hypothetical protein
MNRAPAAEDARKSVLGGDKGEAKGVVVISDQLDQAKAHANS